MYGRLSDKSTPGFTGECNECRPTDNEHYRVIRFLSNRLVSSESYRNYKLLCISDIDGDGYHDIVVDDIRYAGHFFEIVKNYFLKLLVIDLYASSWD